MKRNVLIGTMAVVMLVSGVNSTYAANNGEADEKKNQTMTSTKKLSTWTYNGVEITVSGDRELSVLEHHKYEKNLEKLSSKSSNQGISTEAVTDPQEIPVDDGTGSAQILVGPTVHKYDKYSFAEFLVEQAIRGVSGFYLGKYESPLWLRLAVQNMAAKVWQGFTIDYDDYVYVKNWTSKAWSDYYGFYELLNTQVRYENDYKTIINVYYEQTGKNAAVYGK